MDKRLFSDVITVKDTRFKQVKGVFQRINDLYKKTTNAKVDLWTFIEETPDYRLVHLTLLPFQILMVPQSFTDLLSLHDEFTEQFVIINDNRIR